MKTLNLIRNAGQNYFFGTIQNTNQTCVATFNSPEQVHAWFSAKHPEQGFRMNAYGMDKIIKKEYRMSRTYYQRYQFDDLKFCEKVFNQLAQ